MRFSKTSLIAVSSPLLVAAAPTGIQAINLPNVGVASSAINLGSSGVSSQIAAINTGISGVNSASLNNNINNLGSASLNNNLGSASLNSGVNSVNNLGANNVNIQNGATPASLQRGGFSSADVLVLQFAHVLEQLETDFYTQALQKFQPADFTAAGFTSAQVPIEQFQSIVGDESTHTSTLESVLLSAGVQPLSTCRFDFSSVLTDVTTMATVARLVENVGVGAYLGAAALVDDPTILTAAASILTVEARHQTMLNVLNGGTAIPQAFDIPLAPEQVLAIAGPFISGCDLGVKANPTLTVTNTGPITVGTKLTFQSTGINGAGNGLTCQMLTGGATFAVALPIDNCVVPSGINGPVAIFITNSSQPLLASQQNKASIVAGPAMAFIDVKPETIGSLVRQGIQVAPITSVNTITPAQASAIATAPGAPPATVAPPAVAAPPAPVAGAIGGVTPSAVGSNVAGAPGGPNLATGPSPDGSVTVNGVTTVPLGSTA